MELFDPRKAHHANAAGHSNSNGLPNNNNNNHNNNINSNGVNNNKKPAKKTAAKKTRKSDQLVCSDVGDAAEQELAGNFGAWEQEGASGLQVCMCIYVHVYVRTYMRGSIHAWEHTCVGAYMRRSIHA
jgi:hypothetical protein